MSENATGNEFNYDFKKVSEELCVRPEVLKRLVISFSKTIAEKVKILETARADNDILKMRATLHEIRGTAGNLRLEGILASAKVLHEAIKSGVDDAKIANYFDELKLRAAEFQTYIQKQENA